MKLMVSLFYNNFKPPKPIEICVVTVVSKHLRISNHEKTIHKSTYFNDFILENINNNNVKGDSGFAIKYLTVGRCYLIKV